uniref:Uncharacterized protein n=1 Tax=Siphoviridae sp. ctYh54 TaxID=2826379 RepID=A0A8S5MDT8_9CAUD|nr:MAG TPA: hypothetical protein [Siphoviridae sp. ctYh54]
MLKKCCDNCYYKASMLNNKLVVCSNAIVALSRNSNLKLKDYVCIYYTPLSLWDRIRNWLNSLNM